MDLSSLLYIDQQMLGPSIRPFAGGEVAIYSISGPTGHRINEDAAAVLPVTDSHGVLVVADGAGGLPAGHKASAISVRCMDRAIRKVRQNSADLAKNGSSIREAILDGFDLANRGVLDLGIGAGSTIAILEVKDGEVRAYHVGDSSIIATGQRGKVKLMTMSHSPTSYAVQAGVLDMREALFHEDLNVVSNLVGTADMRIEMGSFLTLDPLDTVVLGSDGLFDNLHLEEVVELVRRGPLSEAAQLLAHECLRRMQTPRKGSPSKPDDLTFVLFRPIH